MAQEYEIGFFGINQLGAAKPCAEGLYGALNLSIFDDEEYLLAFDKFDRDGNGFLDKAYLLFKSNKGLIKVS